MGEAGIPVQPARFPGCFTPLRAVEVREFRIAVELAMDLGQEQVVRQRQRIAIDGFTADDEQRRGHSGEADCFRQRMRDDGAGRGEVEVSTHDDVLPFGQRLADRLPGLATHDDRVTAGQRAKALEIVGQPPRQSAVQADHAITRNGGNQRNPGRRAWRGGRGWCIVHAWLAGPYALALSCAVQLDYSGPASDTPCTTRVHSSNSFCSASCW